MHVLILYIYTYSWPISTCVCLCVCTCMHYIYIFTDTCVCLCVCVRFSPCPHSVTSVLESGSPGGSGAVHEAVIHGAFVPGLPHKGQTQAKPSAPSQLRVVATPARGKAAKAPRRAKSAPLTPTVRESTPSPPKPAQAVPPSPAPSAASSSTASMYQDGTYWRMLDCAHVCGWCAMHGACAC